jgi:predicted aspartyl protease
MQMGLTHVAVRLFNSASSDTYEADFLVDTGAMYTMAPASDLKKIGIQPLGRELYELASGELIEYEYGNAELRFMNESLVLA